MSIKHKIIKISCTYQSKVYLIVLHWFLLLYIFIIFNINKTNENFKNEILPNFEKREWGLYINVLHEEIYMLFKEKFDVLHGIYIS